MGQKPDPTRSEHPNPTTKTGSKMGGAFTYPKMLPGKTKTSSDRFPLKPTGEITKNIIKQMEALIPCTPHPSCAVNPRQGGGGGGGGPPKL